MFLSDNVLARFNNWISVNFDLSNYKVKEKIEHTNSVLNIATQIATEAGFGQEDMFLAKTIAILHDCGRFPQIQIYDSFRDTIEYNHAFEGAKLLQNGLLKEMLPETRKYDKLIISAVKLHGLCTLPELENRERMHCELIRDADRTDLYNMCINRFDMLFWNELGDPFLSPRVKELFERKMAIPFSELNNQIDFLALRLGLINQYVFETALKFLKRENYVNRLVDLFLEKRPYYSRSDVEYIRHTALSFLEHK